MVKVLFVNNTAGEVGEARLQELIERREIAAYCGPDGWVNVKSPMGSGVAAEERTKGRERDDEIRGNKGNGKEKWLKSWQEEKKGQR